MGASTRKYRFDSYKKYHMKKCILLNIAIGKKISMLICSQNITLNKYHVKNKYYIAMNEWSIPGIVSACVCGSVTMRVRVCMYLWPLVWAFVCSSCPKKLTACLLVDFTAAGVVSLVAGLKYLAKYLRVIIGHWSAKCLTAAVNYFPMGET